MASISPKMPYETRSACSMLAGRPVDTRPATYFTRGEYCRISLSRARGEPDSLYSAHRLASAFWAASTSGSRSDWRVALDRAAEAAGPRARCVTAFPIRLAPGGSTKENCHSDYRAASSQPRWGDPGNPPGNWRADSKKLRFRNFVSKLGRPRWVAAAVGGPVDRLPCVAGRAP